MNANRWNSMSSSLVADPPAWRPPAACCSSTTAFPLSSSRKVPRLARTSCRVTYSSRRVSTNSSPSGSKAARRSRRPWWAISCTISRATPAPCVCRACSCRGPCTTRAITSSASVSSASGLASGPSRWARTYFRASRLRRSSMTSRAASEVSRPATWVLARTARRRVPTSPATS